MIYTWFDQTGREEVVLDVYGQWENAHHLQFQLCKPWRSQRAISSNPSCLYLVLTPREQPADSIKGITACLLACLWSLSMFLANCFWSLCWWLAHKKKIIATNDTARRICLKFFTKASQWGSIILALIIVWSKCKMPESSFLYCWTYDKKISIPLVIAMSSKVPFSTFSDSTCSFSALMKDDAPLGCQHEEYRKSPTGPPVSL